MAVRYNRASTGDAERGAEPARTTRAVQDEQRQQWSKERPAAYHQREQEAAEAEAERAAAAGAEDGVDEAEVERYAVHLGMDPARDGELFWIAEQALLAPLPPQWVEVLMEGDATAFQNKLTGVVTWCVCRVCAQLRHREGRSRRRRLSETDMTLCLLAYPITPLQLRGPAHRRYSLVFDTSLQRSVSSAKRWLKSSSNPSPHAEPGCLSRVGRPQLL